VTITAHHPELGAATITGLDLDRAKVRLTLDRDSATIWLEPCEAFRLECSDRDLLRRLRARAREVLLPERSEPS